MNKVLKKEKYRDSQRIKVHNTTGTDVKITGWGEDFSEAQLFMRFKAVDKEIDKNFYNSRSVDPKNAKRTEKHSQLRQTQKDFYHEKKHKGNDKIQKIINKSRLERYTFIKRKSISQLENLFKTLDPTHAKNNSAVIPSISPTIALPAMPEKALTPIFTFFPPKKFLKFTREKVAKNFNY